MLGNLVGDLSLRLFLPRHVGKLLRRLLCRHWSYGLGQRQLGIAHRRATGSGLVFPPRCDAGLKAVMLSGFLVARLHVEQREIRVDELFLGLELLGLVTLYDRGCVITFPIERHAERELRVEIRRLNREDGVQPDNGVIKVAVAESKHRVVV